MIEPAMPTTAPVTFVLRFWRETTDGHLHWRGRIEHVQSGEKVSFLELAAMLDFLRRFGIFLESSHRATRPER